MLNLTRITSYRTAPLRTFSSAIAQQGGRSQADESKVDDWVKKIQGRAKTTEGKGYAVQLMSLITYYNRKPVSEELESIDWEQWKNELNTKSIVDKIRQNHESLLKENYEKEPLVDKVKNSISPFEDGINKEILFHNVLWNVFYFDHLNLKVNIEFAPKPIECAMHEKADLFPGVEAECQRRVETHAYIPGALDDVPFEKYLLCQFAWGKNVSTFYRHPSDDFRGVKATKNILGR